MTDALPFRLRFRVRYAECDPQGVVFNARYAEYVDMATTEFMRAAEIDYAALVAQGVDTKVVNLNLSWSGPAHFDDVLVAEVRCAKIGTKSFTIENRFTHDDGREVARAETVYVAYRPEPFETIVVPAELRRQLEAGGRGLITDTAGVPGPA